MPQNFAGRVFVGRFYSARALTAQCGSSARGVPSSANDALQISLAEESLALAVSRSPVTAAAEANRLLGAHYILGLPANLASLWSTNPAAHEKLMADYRDGRAAGRSQRQHCRPPSAQCRFHPGSDTHISGEAICSPNRGPPCCLLLLSG